MNTSLNHLSPYKTHQLQILTKMIVRKVRPEKIVLFGVHASTDGGLDFSTDTPHPAFFASFDLLVISKRGERRYDYEVMDVIENNAHVETPVNVVVHDIDYVNSQLAVGHYFFTMLAKDAVLLYDAGQVELKEAATPDLISIKDTAQKDFGRWTRSAIGFYRAAQFSQQHKEWRISVFLLHQAAEHTYMAILLTHHLTTSYPLIVKYLVEARDPEYKLQQLLELWAKQGDGFTQINAVAETATNISLRLSALELMAKNSYLKEVASAILADMLTYAPVEMHNKLEAAKQLIKLDDARGVAFIADQIETAHVKTNRSDVGLIHSLAEVKTLDALPYLLRLIAVALRPEVKSQDEIGFFFSPLLGGLFNVGIQSSTALAEVDKQVTAFIAGNEGKLVDLEVLKVNLRRLHERFNAAHAQPMTLHEAIEQYEKVG